jgi:hypothetical protein
MADGDEVVADLRRSFRALAADKRWRGWLAENIYWASCESFLQTTLLPVFNQTSERFVTDRERKLDGNWHPDLAIMSRAHHDEWWHARNVSKNKAALRGLVRGVVQLKIAWTERNANGSARLTEKVKGIRKDVHGLMGRAKSLPEATLLMGVLVAGFHKPAEGKRKLRTAVEQVGSVLNAATGLAPNRVVLLDDFEADHWHPLLRGEKRAWATLVWARLA